MRIGGATPLGDSLSLEPKVAVSYEHGWGDLGDTRSASFAGTGPAFAVGGAGFVSQSKPWRDYGAKVSVGFRF